MTVDYPSKHRDDKVPMLDLKLWIQEVDGIVRLLYEHYEKDMATKMLIHADSAISPRVKRTVLTQEMLRILLHCSKYLPWAHITNHLNGFMKKMQYSGYQQPIRYDIAKSATNAYRTIKENGMNNIRPINRPKNWN